MIGRFDELVFLMLSTVIICCLIEKKQLIEDDKLIGNNDFMFKSNTAETTELFGTF